MHGFFTRPGQYTEYNALLSFGIDAFGASEKSTAERSRPDASSRFSKINAHISQYRDLWGPFGLFLSADGQWSYDPLLLSEEFSLGGPPNGRGYDYGEITGDSGGGGQLELRAGTDPGIAPITFLQGYTFVDGGGVRNYGAIPGYAWQTLASAGVGTRMTLARRIVLNLEAARPLTRVPYNEGDKDWRSFFGITAQY